MKKLSVIVFALMMSTTVFAQEVSGPLAVGEEVVFGVLVSGIVQNSLDTGKVVYVDSQGETAMMRDGRDIPFSKIYRSVPRISTYTLGQSVSVRHHRSTRGARYPMIIDGLFERGIVRLVRTQAQQDQKPIYRHVSAIR